jgi:hypothetical protein
MRQSPKPCNQVQDEANPISSPVRSSMRTRPAAVQRVKPLVPNFQYKFRRILVVQDVE